MRRILVVVAVLVAAMTVVAAPVFAGILGTLKDAAVAAGSSGSLWAGLAVVVLAYVFKAVPNDKIYGFVSAVTEKAGVAVTLGLSKWKWSAPLWNKIIEPWVIDFLNNTAHAALTGLLKGLRADNNGNGGGGGNG